MRFVARRLAVAAVVVAVSMAGGVVPAGAAEAESPAASSVHAAASASAPAPPQTLQSVASSLTVFQGLVDSVTPAPSAAAAGARGGGGDPIGWGLAAIGIAVAVYSTVDTDDRLDVISGQISGIQQTLDQIESQLAGLENQIQQLSEQLAYANCSIQTDAASGPLSVVQSAAQQYSELQQQAIAAGQPAATQVAPTWGQLVGWAQEYTTGSEPLQEAIDQITDVVGGTVDAGSLTACAQALMPSGGGATLGWEATYYANLFLYVSYWYQVQVQALNMYVEAQHVLALAGVGQAAAQQMSPANPQQVCTPPVANGVVQAACNNAQDMVTTGYAVISQQLVQAGAAYGWGTGGQVVSASPWVEGQAGGQYAWLLDINDFQSTGCTLPLTSISTPCGGTVGTSQQFGDNQWGDYAWGSYTGWVPAPTAAWVSLKYNVDGPWQLWQSLAGVGLGDPSWGPGNGLQNLILYTGETALSTQPALNQTDYQNSVVGQCLMDTSWWMQSSWGGVSYPYCDNKGGGSLSTLVADYLDPPPGQPPGWGSFPADYPTNPFAYTDNSFYAAWFPNSTKSGTPWVVSLAPGWLTQTNDAGRTYAQPATPQYRWPVLPLTDAMCTVPSGGPAAQGQTGTMTSLNAGGAPTMCGPDMAAWLDAQLPTAPTPSAPDAVAAQGSLGSADVSWAPGSQTNTNTGYQILGKRGSGSWSTLATAPATVAARSTPTHARMHRRVVIPRAGTWRFKVVARHGTLRSRPSPPSRGDYVPTVRRAWRYYTFKNSKGTIRVAKAFSDGRVYWNSRTRSGFGDRRGGRFVGHAASDRYTWSTVWTQRACGSWRHLRWNGWRRVHGPAESRRGMPLRNTTFPRY